MRTGLHFLLPWAPQGFLKAPGKVALPQGMEMLCISDFTCAAQGYPEVHPCPAINRGGEHLLTHLCQTQLSPSKIVLSTGPPDSTYIMIWCPMSALPTLWVYSDEDDGALCIIYSFIDLRPPHAIGACGRTFLVTGVPRPQVQLITCQV